MKVICIKTSTLFFLFAFWAASCSEPGKKTEIPVTIVASAPNLKEVTLNLPEVEGYQTFIANCGICHSPRYIQDQPKLPAKTWEAIVTKMRKTFGAPVSDSSAKIIVQYLVAVKGKG
jgi:mono/diheme cytochrome c family protein